ncbi:MAG: RidA family protein [Pseudomonadota bacterium]
MRKLISSGSYLEPEIGFSRAVRVGDIIAVSGTAPIGESGETIGEDDVYAQTMRCLNIASSALAQAGGRMEDVIRSRIMLTDVTTWREAARAHGEVFGAFRPACTFVEVSRFIDPGWLVEIEIDAIVHP